MLECFFGHGVFFFFFLVLRDRGGSSYTAVDLTDPFGILNIG